MLLRNEQEKNNDNIMIFLLQFSQVILILQKIKSSRYKMKNDLRYLLVEVEKKIGRKISPSSDFEKLATIFTKHHIRVNSNALRKVWGYLKGIEKPSHETLDKLALFVGFQNWADFQKALHGEDDGQTNYEADKNK